MFNRRTVPIAVICLLYVLLRFWRLTDSCLWFDEIFSIHAATHSWGTILNFISLDLIHPPCFYLLLKVWIAIGGESLFWLRLLPVIFSIVALVPFLALCSDLKLNQSTQIVALFLLTINGSLIKYAQEVRMYSLLMCLSLFSMWLFVRWFYRDKSFLALVIVNILLVYTHYFGWFVIGAEVIAILLLQRGKLRRVAVMFGITVACFLPWAITVATVASSGSRLGQNIGWITRPGPAEIAMFGFDLVEPFYYQTSSAEPSSIFLVSVPLLVIGFVAIVLFLIGWKNRDESERSVAKLLLIFIIPPLAIALSASWIFSYSVWGTRHLIAVFAPLFILIAFAAFSVDRNGLKTALITVSVLFVGYAFALEIRRERTENSWCVWEPLAAEWVSAPHESPEPKVLYAFEELIGYHLWFAARDFPSTKINVVKGFGASVDDPAYFLPRGFDGVKVVDEKKAFAEDEFWVAFRDPDPHHNSPFVVVGSTPAVLSELSRLGFDPEEVRKIRAESESAFIVKMFRRP